MNQALSREKKNVELATAKSILLWQKCKRDRYFWLTNYVKTKDEHDFEIPVKPFPIKPYTKPLIDLFENEQTFYLAKSRQVQATWLFCALALHTIMFFEHRLVLVISKKQDDAFGLIERLRFIYNRLPLWMQSLSPLDRPMRDQPMGNLFIRNGSKVTGLPEGPDQVRMHTASLILLDEAAFQDNLELTIGACNPSLFGGGKSIVFSSMAPGHFQKITDIDEPFSHGDDEMIRGFKVKTNAQGVKIAQLHYSADPDKDPETEQGKIWFTKSSNLYPGGINSPTWRREMEIDPKAGAGERVFPDFFEKEKDIVCDPITPDHTYSLYGGFDWGTRNAVSFHVYAFGMDGSITAIWEYVAHRATLPVVAEAVRGCPYYGRLEWIAADPSMWTENQAKKDGFTSIARMFTEDLPEHLRLDKLMSAHGRGDMRFKQKLEVYWQRPPYKVKIARNCPKLIEELRNLRYPPAMVDKNDPEKILDKDNHSWDDFKYAVMSHPSQKIVESKPTWGTIEHHNRAYEAALEISAQTGQSVDDIFNEILHEVAA